jgi:hydroxylamine reductase
VLARQNFLRQNATAASSVIQDDQQMFCFQCEQTRLRKGCTTVGVCGKTPQVAELQDLLVHAIRGLSLYSNAAAKLGVKIPFEIYDFTFSSLFSTLTNVNFDPDRFPPMIKQAIEYRDHLKKEYESECAKQGTSPRKFTQLEATWNPDVDLWVGPTEQLEVEGRQFGVNRERDEYGADVHGVRQMIIYGLKGMSTYARHARLLGEWDDSIGAFTHEVLAFLVDGDSADRHDLGKTLEWALKVGEFNLKGMSLLDAGHRKRFGVPTPTEVRTSPVPGKAILVTGHDMNDLEMILKATDGRGINVYTHGEMLPAHGYPGLHKFKHLVGHYGGAWQNQKYEFPSFPGPIIVTTNCIIEPMKSYKSRLYTLNETGWPGCHHVHLPNEVNKLIDAAVEAPGFTEAECQQPGGSVPGGDKILTVGFGHDVILANAAKVLGAVASGELKRVFVIGGCDGSENKRSYFTTLADSLPKETLILTLGCAKYRFNRHEFGTLGTTGLPRLLDMGQCNDAYGAVVVASALADALKTDINSLPLSITLSWFEQKAIAVLLTMLHLGIRNMRIGPVLPAFLTPKVVEILAAKYNIVPCDMRHPIDDLKLMMQQ